MEHLLYQAHTQSALSIVDLLVGLTLSLVLGLFLSFVYRFTHKGATFEKTFLISLTLMAPVITLIIMFIGSNLTLSLGMVGALSIVRFRTAIKDSRDMLFLFLSIAIGLGCGTFNWKATLAGAVFFYIVMMALRWTKLESPLNQSFVLSVRANHTADILELQKKIQDQVSSAELRALEAHGDEIELVLEIKAFKQDNPPEKIVLQVRAHAGVKSVSLLAPQIRLPI